MFGFKKRVEIFRKRDKDTWSEIKKVLSEEKDLDFKAGHFLQETVTGCGCGAKLDPRDFGSKGKIDRDIYWIKVAENDVDRANEVLQKAGITAEVDKNIFEDASKRINKSDK